MSFTKTIEINKQADRLIKEIKKEDDMSVQLKMVKQITDINVLQTIVRKVLIFQEVRI